MANKIRFILNWIMKAMIYIILALCVFYTVFKFFHETELEKTNLHQEDEILKLTGKKRTGKV